MPFSARMSSVRTVSLSAGLSQPRGALPTPFGDGADHLLDESPLLSLGLAVDQRRIVVAVSHPLPTELIGLLDNARIVRADVGVQRDGAFDAVLLHDLHHAPNTDAHAVVAPRIVQHVRIDRQVGEPRRGAVEQEMLDIGDHPHRDARTVRPRQPRPVDDRRIFKAAVLGRYRRRRRHAGFAERFFFAGLRGTVSSCVLWRLHVAGLMSHKSRLEVNGRQGVVRWRI